MMNQWIWKKPKLEISLQNGTIWKSYFENLYQKLEPDDLNLPQSKIKKEREDLKKTIKNIKIHRIHL